MYSCPYDSYIVATEKHPRDAHQVWNQVERDGERPSFGLPAMHAAAKLSLQPIRPVVAKSNIRDYMCIVDPLYGNHCIYIVLRCHGAKPSTSHPNAESELQHKVHQIHNRNALATNKDRIPSRGHCQLPP